MATDSDVVGAIRLAVEAAGNDLAALSLVKALLQEADPTPADATGPTKVLIDKVREAGNWELTNA